MRTEGAWVRILDAGDTALAIEFAERCQQRSLAIVAALDETLANAMASGKLPGVVETVPTLRSLTVIYDPLQTTRATLEPIIRHALAVAGEGRKRCGRHWRLPVCYGDQLASAGPDIADVAAACGLIASEVVRRHAATDYTVYMLGFLPGFAFMGELDPALVRPRRSEPRLRVPAGSVAVASTLTAIYPWDSPGGWHLLGRCPVPLFSPDWDSPALLQPGDQVSFRAVAEAEYHDLSNVLATMRLSPHKMRTFLVEAMLDDRRS